MYLTIVQEKEEDQISASTGYEIKELSKVINLPVNFLTKEYNYGILYLDKIRAEGFENLAKKCNLDEQSFF